MRPEAGTAGIIDDSRHWWPQAEAGFLNAYELTGDEKNFQASLECSDFVARRLIDRQHGESYWRVFSDGTPDPARMKVDRWKCPYYNSRMCFEVMARLDHLLRK